MTETTWSAGIPKEVIIVGMAMLPILELRGAIPWALKFAPQIPLVKTYLLAVGGNFIPVIPILLLLDPVSRFLRRASIFDRFFRWLFARTRRRGKLIEKYEAIGLTLFVAVPLPVTGAWTGALAAFVFGIRFRWAVVCIGLGILLAGVVVTLASLGVLGALSYLLRGF